MNIRPLLVSVALALCIFVSPLWGAFTERYVTKHGSASDTNGGSGVGAPKYTLAAGAGGATSTDNGADSDVEDLNNGSWGTTAVDDWLCFDTGDTVQVARVKAIDVGADEDVITVTPQLTELAQKGCNVGGAFATAQRAADVVAATSVNAAGHVPRVNIGPGTYAEEVDFDTNSGSISVPITYEGYYATAGDEADNAGTWTPPVIDGSTLDAKAATVLVAAAKDNLRFRNLSIIADGAGIHGVQSTGDQCLFENILIAASGAGAEGYYGLGFGNRLINLDVTAADYGMYVGAVRDTLIGCVVHGGDDSFLFTANGIRALFCIADNPGDDAFLVENASRIVLQNCTAYSPGGSGVNFVAAQAEGTTVINCIFSECVVAGIETDAAAWIVEDYNAFYSCGVNVDADIVTPGENPIALTADPFITAGTNFGLNNAAGGGAACKRAGWPGAFLDGNSTGYIDIGAVQSYSGGGRRRVDGGLVH